MLGQVTEEAFQFTVSDDLLTGDATARNASHGPAEEIPIL